MTIPRLAGCFLAAVMLMACASGSNQTATSFNVFFAGEATTLSPDAQAIVGQAAQAIGRQRPATVTIAAGADSATARLAEPRYEAVRQALVARGVAAGSIARASLPQIEANTGSTAAQRVEIILSASP